jgi:acyl-CoA synthetase (AMP-forming)/AMP-acid ligase II
MKRLVNAAFAYMLAGVASGLFYREFTKANDFTDATFTQLSVVHTHLLILGFVMLLIVLVLEKVFTISRSPRLFSWFLWLYNAGVILTAGMMVWHGILTVLGKESNGMIAGIAGLGHILVTAGLIVFFLALRRAVAPGRTDQGESAPAAA